jgi:hypothetical protein
MPRVVFELTTPVFERRPPWAASFIRISCNLQAQLPVNIYLSVRDVIMGIFMFAGNITFEYHQDFPFLYADNSNAPHLRLNTFPKRGRKSKNLKLSSLQHGTSMVTFLELRARAIFQCVSCRVVRVTIMTGSSSDDWILLGLRLQPLLITLNYKAISVLHNLQSTAGHALGFSVCTTRLLATDLNTETSTSSHS